MPRIAPLPLDEWDEEIRPVAAGGMSTPDGSPLHIFGTLANHPKLMKRWVVFANHVLSKSTLSARDRELLILRAGWNCKAPYEWGQHVAIALRSDITQEEIDRIPAGPGAPGWDPFDALLLRLADELHENANASDATWSKLAERYSTQQLMDAVFAVGQYTLVSYALNTFGVEREAGVVGLPPDPS
jgi:alkylhydroperoxidase family enzyme